MGSLEAWLLLRSLRTLHLRVPRQSENAAGLAHWLSQAAGVCCFPVMAVSQMMTLTPRQGRTADGIPAGVIEKVWHSSLQSKDSRGFDPRSQLEGGWNPTFSILVCAFFVIN